ncbi:MAG: MATE family efflux transporter, partial [Firmicutes bacterium]|nr:MATE family efflux transporter [Bacillota bacterium]
AGDTKFSSFLSMVGMWGVRVPLAYILIHFFGFSLMGVWLPMALDWTMRCLLMTIRYRRGKWKNVWKPA